MSRTRSEISSSAAGAREQLISCWNGSKCAFSGLFVLTRRQGRAFAGQGAGAVSMSLSQFLRSPCDAMAMLRSKASAGEIMARPCVGLRLIDHVPDISLHTRVVSCRCLALRMQSVRIDAIFPKGTVSGPPPS